MIRINLLPSGEVARSLLSRLRDVAELQQRKCDQLLGEIPLKLCASARIGRPSGSP